MQRTNIYLDDRQVDALDRLAQLEGVSRAELVRRMVDRGLDAGSNDIDDDLAAIEASFGVLGDVEMLPRSADARATHLEEIRRR